MDTQNATAGPTNEPAKPLFSTRRILLIAVLGLAAGAAIYFAPQFFSRGETAPTYPALQMGGTSTMFVVAENEWKKKYRDEKGVQLAFDSVGSTAGGTRLLDGSVAVAFTHGSLTPDQRQKAKEKGDVVHIPILFFGVAPVYNVKELKGKAPLNVSGELLADIFSGKVTKWNDPAIEKLNPALAPLPATPITVVHRKESSGTTRVFTEYLDAATAAAGTWRNKMGAPAADAKWPTGPNFVAVERNLGVATKVYETEGAIGYVDQMFTKYDVMELDQAAVQNKDKTAFVRAEPQNMTAAATGLLATLPDDLIFDLTNKPGKDAYPISGTVYAVCLQTQPADAKKAVVDFLRWATHEGQATLAKMTYAPLPPELVKRIDQKLDAIK